MQHTPKLFELWDVMLEKYTDFVQIDKYNEVLSLLKILFQAAFDYKFKHKGSTHATRLLNLTTKSLALLMKKYAKQGMGSFVLNNGKFFVQESQYELIAKTITIKDKVETSDKLDFSSFVFSKVENLNQSICGLNDLYVPANEIKK